MAEEIVNSYRRLFAVRLLHHYWLDEGATVFDAIASQPKREERLLSYDARSFLAIAPTVTTAEALKDLGCEYKSVATGCIVAAPKTGVIPDDAVFEFTVTVQDPSFYNYTALTLRQQKIYELFHLPEKKTYRYKENVPLLSNLTGASRGTGPDKVLFLSTDFPALAADDKAEALFVSGSDLMQLTGDQPGAASQQLASQAGEMPVFVHQGDAAAIVPPAGLAGAPARGIELKDGMPNQIFALIRLSALRPDDSDFSFIDGDGHPKAESPVFEVRLKNRSTVWKYFDKGSGEELSVESEPLPLTYFGNAGDKQKPWQGLVKAVKSGDQVTQLVSEIYI